jgi:glycerate dehydrogenase
MEIVILDGYTINPGDLSWKGFSAFDRFAVYDRTLPEQTRDRIAGAAAVLTNKVVLDRETIFSSPKLRYIGVLATGYNVVDTDAANEAGITVTNVPSYSTASVAQLVFAHLLNIVNGVDLHAREVARGAWSQNPDFSFCLSRQMELNGKIMGIIGFGRIGQKVAELATAFGMKVIFNNRSVRRDIPYRQVSLEELLRRSDVVSINCPLTSGNKGFINKKTLGLMKRNAILINTGRGQLIQEEDLAEALNNEQIFAAGLDVLSQEPPRENPLLSAKNCFITPHIAWATTEARERLIQIALSNFEAYLNGKPQNVVNNPDFLRKQK